MEVFAVAVYDGPSETHFSVFNNEHELKVMIDSLGPDDFSDIKVFEKSQLVFDETALTDLISDYLVIYEENGIDDFLYNVSGLCVRNEVLSNPNRKFKLFVKLSLF